MPPAGTTSDRQRVDHARRDLTMASIARCGAHDGSLWSAPAMPHALIVVPTYNERDNVRAIVARLLTGPEADVLFVDDNSPDGTGAVLDELAIAEPRIHV